MSIYTMSRAYLIALDPVRIGMGSVPLGLVDNPVVREVGTGLPKLPGASLAGAARAYAAQLYGKPEAAGRQREFLGQADRCPIMQTFGTIAGGNFPAKVSIGDAHIVLFPLRTMSGPVWITTEEVLAEVWGQDAVQLPEGSRIDDTQVSSTMAASARPGALNLGYLVFEALGGARVRPPEAIGAGLEWRSMERRLVLVPPARFSLLVNSNLEVRSVTAVDQVTGSAEQGSLQTYEAVPRGTVFSSDWVEDPYPWREHVRGVAAFPVERQFRREGAQENAGDPLPQGGQWERPLDVVADGFRLMEYLGVGGKSSRGFGRLRLLALVEGGSL